MLLNLYHLFNLSTDLPQPRARPGWLGSFFYWVLFMVPPLSRAQVNDGANWLLLHFSDQINQACRGKPYRPHILCALACRETGFIWIPHTRRKAPRELLPMILCDSGGNSDLDGLADLHVECGPALYHLLVDQGNQARSFRSLRPSPIPYRGYGIFRYDLHHVRTDREFFERLKWYDFDQCLARICRELDPLYRTVRPGDHLAALSKYRSSRYAEHVLAFAEVARGR